MADCQFKPGRSDGGIMNIQIKKECESCGKVFQTNRPYVRLCSASCRKFASKKCCDCLNNYIPTSQNQKRCISCGNAHYINYMSEYRKKWYRNNLKKIKEQSHKRYMKNREFVIKKSRLRDLLFPEKARARGAKYREKTLLALSLCKELGIIQETSHD